MLLELGVVGSSGTAFIIHGDEYGLARMLLEPVVETEEHVFKACSRCKESLCYATEMLGYWKLSVLNRTYSGESR